MKGFKYQVKIMLPEIRFKSHELPSYRTCFSASKRLIGSLYSPAICNGASQFIVMESNMIHHCERPTSFTMSEG